MTPEELAAIRERDATDSTESPFKDVLDDRRALLAHIDAITSPDVLAEAMDEAYDYKEDYVPSLPFMDDNEGFWDPFAAKVSALLRGTPQR